MKAIASSNIKDLQQMNLMVFITILVIVVKNQKNRNHLKVNNDKLTKPIVSHSHNGILDLFKTHFYRRKKDRT